MKIYKIDEINNKKIWEDYILSQNPKSFLHSWGWGETNILLGKKVFRVGIYKGNKIAGLALYIKEKARRGWHLVVPGGPILDFGNRELVEEFIIYSKKLAVIENCTFVRLRPELLETQKNRILFKNLGFITSPMHLHAQNTWILDITGPDEQILSNMRKTTRYLVRKGIESDLEIIQSVRESDAKYVKELQDRVMVRHSFVGFSEKYFRSQVAAFASDNKLKIFLIKHEGEVVVAALIIFYGERVFYHNSGSSDEGLKLNASYRLLWEVIQEAKKRGLKYFDTWGATPPGRSNHRFAGPSLFKEGFGGERVDWLPAQDLPVNFKYWVTYVFEVIRKHLRNL